MIKSYIGAGVALVTWRVAVRCGVGWAVFTAVCELVGFGVIDLGIRFGKTAARAALRPKAKP